MTEPSWLKAAEARQKGGDFAGAIHDYRMAIQTWLEAGEGSGYPILSAYFHLGLACRAEGRLAEALESYQAAAKLVGIRGRFLLCNLYYSGCAYFAQGNVEAGKAEHRRLLDLLSRPDTAKDFSPEFMHPRDLDLAIEDCSRAGDDFCRGLAKKAKEDWAGAIADLGAACKESPQNAAIRQWWLTARILRNGFPNPNFPQTLQPGIEYVSVWYQEDRPAQVHVTYYAAEQEPRTESYTRAKGVQIHGQFQNSDDWILLNSHGHQEGSVHYYWRAAEGIARQP